ncbi:MAG: RDD family protein [Gammaproteobacteria bacterium]|nr:RDD family protein [Gammaproteobacteria bacterium]
MSEPRDSQQWQRCSLPRRLGVILYDTMLLAAVIFIAFIPLTLLMEQSQIGSSSLLKTLYLFTIAYGFFAWFWVHGGQTLGMQAWRVRVVQCHNHYPLTYSHALLRFLVAICSWLSLGLGFFWSLIDKEQRSWHDIYSETCLVMVPKEPPAT